MNNKIIIILTIFSFFCVNNSFSYYSEGISIEMFLMRKGKHVKIVLQSNGANLPEQLEIERKSTSPLSKYRKVMTINKEQMETLGKDKKLILTDNYPESRQLDSYYRIKFITKEGIIRKIPAVYLPKASNKNSVTFGDHEEDERMFETEEEKFVLTYEAHNLSLNVKSEGTAVLITIAGGEALNGLWLIERKSTQPLSTFRRIKVISSTDKELTKKGEHVFTDKYPESRKLDVYYRLKVILENGDILDFPSVMLERTSNSRK